MRWYVIMVGGAIMMVLGFFAIVYVYTFATIVDPRLGGMDRRLAILSGMFLTPSVAIVIFGLIVFVGGTVIVAISLLSAFGICAERHRLIAATAAFVAIALLAAIVLVVGL